MTQGSNDGWYQDPWQRWPERYYEAGQYTDRVRTGAAEGRDPLPYPPPFPPGYNWSGYGYNFQPAPKTGTARTGPLPLHPMSMGDILDGAFRLYRANFKSILIIVAAIDGPIQFIGALLRRNEFGGTSIFNFNGVAQQNSGGTSTSTAIGLIVLAVVSIVALPLTGGAVSRVVSASYMGGVETPAAALRAMVRKSFALLVAAVFVHVIEVVSFFFLILPGLIFMAMYVSVSPAIMVEGLGPFAGMGRSWSLTRGRMWRVMGTAIVCGIIVSIIGSVVADPFSFAGAAVGLHWGWILVFIGGLLGNLVTLALNAVVATLIYFDGRIRHEGFDLQILARGIGA